MKATDNTGAPVPIWEPMFELAHMPGGSSGQAAQTNSSGEVWEPMSELEHMPESSSEFSAGHWDGEQDHATGESGFEEAMMLGR